MKSGEFEDYNPFLDVHKLISVSVDGRLYYEIDRERNTGPRSANGRAPDSVLQSLHNRHIENPLLLAVLLKHKDLADLNHIVFLLASQSCWDKRQRKSRHRCKIGLNS